MSFFEFLNSFPNNSGKRSKNLKNLQNLLDVNFDFFFIEIQRVLYRGT